METVKATEVACVAPEPTKATEISVVGPNTPVIVGQPVHVSDANPVLGLEQSSGLALDPPGCTCLTAVGNSLLGLEIFSAVMEVVEVIITWMIDTENESIALLRVLRLVIWVEFVVAIVAIVLLFRERPTPRGCGCFEACRTAISGCYSCPCLPWGLGGLAIFNFLGGLATIAGGAAGGGTYDLVAGVFILIFAMLLGTAGFGWVYAFKQQRGYYCCASPGVAS